ISQVKQPSPFPITATVTTDPGSVAQPSPADGSDLPKSVAEKTPGRPSQSRCLRQSADSFPADARAKRARHANGKTAWRQRLAVAARRRLICLIGRFFLRNQISDHAPTC